MVLKPVMSNKEAIEIIEKKIVQKYDEEDKCYLAPNDGSSALITLVQLKDNNFDKWADTIELTLESKNKLGFLDGSIPQPNEDDSICKQWKKINTLISSWILNTIKPVLRSSIMKTRL